MYSVGIENSATQPRDLDGAQTKRLNLYGHANATFFSFGRGEPVVVPTPHAAPPHISVLGSNPLNSVAVKDPGVVDRLLDQNLNRTADATLGDVLRSVPQTGRGYRNQTMSFPTHTPQPHMSTDNGWTHANAEARLTRTV